VSARSGTGELTAGEGAANLTAVTGMPAGGLRAGRDAPVGGQAVLEGVMMRGVSHWAVAVRAPVPSTDEAEEAAPSASDNGDGVARSMNGSSSAVQTNGDGAALADKGHGAGLSDNGDGAALLDNGDGAALADDSGAATPPALGSIEVKEFELTPASRRHRIYRAPVIRGVVALVGSLKIGMRALTISANMAMGEQGEEIGSGAWTGAIVLAVVFAVGLFFVVPVTVTSLVKQQLGSAWLFWLVEGVLRTAIFLGYLVLLSRMRDMRRVLEYHGAEHKVISCYEAGDELTPERAKLYSRLHPRCGTSFLLVVMLVAIVVFAPIGLPAWWILVLTRIIGVPLIAGLSFELIRWASRHRSSPGVKAIMYPGLSLQKLTTREPDLDQLSVSIAALTAVLAHETPGALSAEDLVGLEVVA
jgi:uncharacterized protein YqhQ